VNEINQAAPILRRWRPAADKHNDAQGPITLTLFGSKGIDHSGQFSKISVAVGQRFLFGQYALCRFCAPERVAIGRYSPA